MAPPNGILTMKMVEPPTTPSCEGVVSSRGVGRGGGLFKLKCPEFGSIHVAVGIFLSSLFKEGSFAQMNMVSLIVSG